MKTTHIKIVVFVLFLLSHFSIYAQYNGGDSDGAALDVVTGTTCSSLPPSFFAYLGGNADGASVNDLLNTSCGITPSQYAFLGGNADGAAVEELAATVCGTPPSFFAYFGGNSDGAGVETLESTTCPFPPSFYAYFGGNSDGFSVDATAAICPTTPPVASFTASALEICVGQTISFTDTSTNIPAAWTWTLTGGTPGTSTVQNPTITYNTPGTYDVTLVAANYNGTDTATIQITVYAYPIVTSTTPASRCDAGIVTLEATTNIGTLNWYDAATGGNLVGTGTSFTTPSLSASTTYYVESINGVCSSARSMVIATVNTTPTITGTTPATRCGSGLVTISATASAGTIRWYDAPTAGTLLATGANYSPNVPLTTTYYVETTLNSCTSPRIAVVVTINEIPTITSTTAAARCDAGIMTLQATASSGTINWYDAPSGGNLVGTGTNFTTPSISLTTTYYVESILGTCSATRTAVTATVSVTPSITSTTASNRCDAGSVTLFASANAGIVNWYDAATGGTLVGTGTSFTTPSILSTTSYYVEAVNGSCASGTRTEVIATINNSPTITSTAPTTICGGDTFTISATASAGSLAWFNVPTGGLVQGTGNSFSLSNWTTTTTFYVQATDGPCQSARIPVVVTVNDRPFNTTLTPASRCGTGTVTLAATYTVGTINWYANPIGGTPIATGSSFTTPSITTSTTYYVEAENNGCISLIRTAITATVYEVPVITSTTPASKCGTGSVQLQVTSNVGTISWFENSVGGTALATGGTFNTPSLTTSTTYYVEVSNGTCTSARTPVTASIFTAVNLLSTTPASRCDAGTLTLSATTEIFGTLNWYDMPSGGTLLGTGLSFTTPSISTSTTYYVESTNGVCTSTRIAVIASINPTAAPTGIANQTFCTGETVELIVVTGSNIVWYDAASGGNIVPTGTALVSGTTYYASQSVTGCESPTRLAVTMTSGGCLGSEEFIKNTIRLYPNPAIDYVTITSSELISKVEVVNMLGQIILFEAVQQLETTIDLSIYATGSYIVRVYSDENVKLFKVIKK